MATFPLFILSAALLDPLDRRNRIFFLRKPAPSPQPPSPPSESSCWSAGTSRGGDQPQNTTILVDSSHSLPCDDQPSLMTAGAAGHWPTAADASTYAFGDVQLSQSMSGVASCSPATVRRWPRPALWLLTDGAPSAALATDGPYVIASPLSVSKSGLLAVLLAIREVERARPSETVVLIAQDQAAVRPHGWWVSATTAGPRAATADAACFDRFSDDVQAVAVYLLQHATTAHGEHREALELTMEDFDRLAERDRTGAGLTATAGTDIGPLALRAQRRARRQARWLAEYLDDPWLEKLAAAIMQWVGLATTGNTGAALVTELDAGRHHDWYGRYVERPLGRKQAPLCVAVPLLAGVAPTAAVGRPSRAPHRLISPSPVRPAANRRLGRGPARPVQAAGRPPWRASRGQRQLLDASARPR